MDRPLTRLKSIFAILIFFSFQQILFSQNAFTIGIKGGIVSNKYVISGEDMSNVTTDSRTGLEIGFTAQLFRSKYFMLVPEISYLQRGMGPDSNYRAFPSGKTFASYLSFNLLPTFRIDNKFLNPFIYLGPHFEILLSNDSGNVVGFSDSPSKTNFGFTTGLGLEKKLTQKLTMSIEFRYSRDLTYFIGSWGPVNSYYYRSSSFDILTGVNYALGGSKK